MIAPPIHTVDGSGLSNTGTVGNNPGTTMWLSNGETSPTITWDLGISYSLSGLQLWNYNEIPGGGNNPFYPARGIQTADVLVSSNPSFTNAINLGTMTFNEATGQTTYAGSSYNLPSSATGRYVRFTSTTNFSNMPNIGNIGPYTGLSEIRFQGTPTPVTLLAPAHATASSFYAPDDRSPGHTIDGSGLDGNGEHGTTPSATMWLTNTDDPNPYIQFDLAPTTQAFPASACGTTTKITTTPTGTMRSI